ncbi:MAG TPA: FHIPEP family type III secretion protein, partial [Povalibacter sp.]|nr:FHIPEP family type III secretion protein [Povalibacter sp.]
MSGGFTAETTAAVILGSQDFSNSELESDPAFAISAAEFKRYLLDSAGLGLPPENLLDLFDDERGPNDIDKELDKFLVARTAALEQQNKTISDVILFYTGHGKVEEPNQVFVLTLKATRRVNILGSAYQITVLSNTLKARVRYARRIVILDCCFAGAAYTGFQSGVLDVVVERSRSAFPPRGTALLCASSHDRATKSRTKAGATASGMTLFSESLLFALRNGIARIPRDRMSLGEVGDLVEELVRERFSDEGQRPEVKSPDERSGDVARLPIFPNPAFLKARADAETNAEFDFTSIRQRYLTGTDATAAPVIVAIQHADEPITDDQLLPAERHLTVSLSAEQVEELANIGAQLSGPGLGIPQIFGLGQQAWEVLKAAEKRLERLFARIQRSRVPQPVGWAGLTPLLLRIRRALLVAGCSDVDSLNLLGVGDHYFWPLSSPGTDRRIEQRPLRIPKVAVMNGGEPGEVLRNAGDSEVVMLCAERLPAALDGLLQAIRMRKSARARVVMGFGDLEVSADGLHKALEYFPCVSFAGPASGRDNLRQNLEQSIPAAAGRHAMPSVIASFRREWIRQALKRDDIRALLAAIDWTTWSYVGRPLFAMNFGVMQQPAYPHLTDLRTIAPREWNFERRAEIPKPYQIRQLAQPPRGPEAQNNRFHLYLSGAGGTGKSCFLRAVHDELLDRPNAMPVWYRVDAPNSAWTTVERRIREEIEAAATLKFAARAREFLPAPTQRLANYLSQFAANLKSRNSGVDDLVIFIDQLERTFESGDQPNLERLNGVSKEVIELLGEVGTGSGVRVFIASRKQYLPDFLRSYEHASMNGLHFNVLQTIGDHNERIGFVEKIWQFCHDERLIDDSVSISKDASDELTGAVKGHPLEIVLALMYLFSQVPRGEITVKTLEVHQPAEKLFNFDIRLMSRDDLDRYFMLAMAHARAEIVDLAEVWWRLHLVTTELTSRVDRLGQKCVLETLWLKGHLGRTLHTRADDKGEARFLEFFHANLRDHLLRDVMSLPHGTPPAWRALDRLAAAARDWEQMQRPLDRDDLRALMVHRQFVLEPTGTDSSEGREIFYLLFIRNADSTDMCAAAKECFVFSAVVHAESSRAVFLEVFPRIEDRIRVCGRWIARSYQIEHRYRILEFLVTQDTVETRLFLASSILNDPADGGFAPWIEIAQILAEPLYAARYRSEVALTVLREHFRDKPMALRSVADFPRRFREFVITSCGRDRNELNRCLADCAGRQAATEAGSLSADLLKSTVLLDLLVEEAHVQFDSGRTFLARDLEEEERPHFELVVGTGLEAIARSESATWHKLLVERIGIPLHPFSINLDQADEAKNEMRLRIKGKSIEVEAFFPPKCQVLMRHWERTQTFIPQDIDRNDNEMVRETVFWMDPHYLSQANWTLPMWTASEAIVDWLEASLRNCFDDVLDEELLDQVLQQLEGQQIDLSGIKTGTLRHLLVDLVHEAVPFQSRWQELVRVLKQESKDAEEVTRKVRNQVGVTISEALADDTNQLAVILLDPALEKTLEMRLSRGEDNLGFGPGQANAFVNDVRRLLEHSWREHDLMPVVVCEQYL